MTDFTWEIASATISHLPDEGMSSFGRQLLREGWEPFGASERTDTIDIIWFRRKVAVKLPRYRFEPYRDGYRGIRMQPQVRREDCGVTGPAHSHDGELELDPGPDSDGVVFGRGKSRFYKDGEPIS